MQRSIFIVMAVAAVACNRNEGAGSEDTDVRTEINAAERTALDDKNAEAVDKNAEARAAKDRGNEGDQANEPVAADNTEKNERDRDKDALTPGDQGESEADRRITQQVRQGIVGHDTLSTTAENVKIITVDGVVTLRGPVESAQERSTIASVAQGVAGVKRVDNHLEIESR